MQLANHTVILKKLISKGGTGNVMDMVEWDAARFEEGFALANDMQNRDLVKLLYSNFNTNRIVVELTLIGESEGRT